jgi:hypothetical protein
VKTKSPLFLLGIAALVAPVLLSACTPSVNKTTPTVANAITPSIGNRTKTSGCQVQGKLPDSACTPGAIISTATKDQICTPGYSKNVRDVTTSEKNQVYAEYDITHHSAGEYEVDHLISLELGGSNDIANLWPEPAEPRPGFHEKDKVENYLHDQMCSGAISLPQAQVEIATDWMSVYDKLPQK